MAKIKEIVDNARAIATANPNISSFLYGFQSDFNVRRDTADYPLLMFQKFIDTNPVIDFKLDQVEDLRWTVILYMAHKLVAGENIEDKQQEMEDFMREFRDSFLSTSNYNLASEISRSYFQESFNNNNVGVKYEFTLGTQLCN